MQSDGREMERDEDDTIPLPRMDGMTPRGSGSRQYVDSSSIIGSIEIDRPWRLQFMPRYVHDDEEERPRPEHHSWLVYLVSGGAREQRQLFLERAKPCVFVYSLPSFP